jgi:hypothetical protein
MKKSEDKIVERNKENKNKKIVTKVWAREVVVVTTMKKKVKPK